MALPDQLRLDGKDRDAVDTAGGTPPCAAEPSRKAQRQASTGRIDLCVKPFQGGDELEPPGRA
jgi:hypothetical protein